MCIVLTTNDNMDATSVIIFGNCVYFIAYMRSCRTTNTNDINVLFLCLFFSDGSLSGIERSGSLSGLLNSHQEVEEADRRFTNRTVIDDSHLHHGK